MADVVLDGVRKVYPGGFVAIDHLDLEVRDGEFLVLVGPSGCGKSTALRMVAGLEPITSGECRVGGLRVNEVAPRDRDIAMVFQNYALYPHMTVAENIGFSLKLAGMRRAEVKRRVAEVAAAIELGHLLSSKPGQLSGGQRQRVAMGRAIVRHPKVFLMDEPLSNLDAKLRGQMRAEISKISKNLGVTTIYVTHDQVEAMTMGDRVAVLEAGHMRQINTPQALYDNPANLFVAGFMGSPSMNLMRVVLDRRDSTMVVKLGPRDLPLPSSVIAERPRLSDYLGREVALGVRPEHFTDARAMSGDEAIAATATLVESLGSEILVHFDLDVPSIQVDQDIAAEVGAGGSRIARFDPKTAVRVGSPLRVAIDFDRAHFFDLQTGEAIRAA